MTEPIAWIPVLKDDEFDDAAREIYGKLRRPDGDIHNLYRAYSIWPTALPAAHHLYQAVLHAPDGPLEFSLREMLAAQVALLTRCAYAEAHHGENFKRSFGDRRRAEAMLDCLRRGTCPDDLFDARQRAMVTYNAKLTKTPEEITEGDIQALRTGGLKDREILQVNQISANFNYWVRVINGLGIALGGEAVGMDQAALDEIAAACETAS